MLYFTTANAVAYRFYNCSDIRSMLQKIKTNNSHELGIAIDFLIVFRKIGYAQFAADCGVSESAIKYIRKGETEATRDTLDKFATELNCKFIVCGNGLVEVVYEEFL